MIAFVQPLHAGNALRLFVEPPRSAVLWKVLRKASDTFSGQHDEPTALVAYEGTDKVFVDAQALPNEQMAFYKPFYSVPGQSGFEWQAGPVAHGTPAAIFQEQTTDVQAFLRERLEAGLKVECDRKNFRTEMGYIPVMSEFPTSEQDVRFPMVTVHLEHESSGERGVGEMVALDEFMPADDEWIEAEGWLADVRITCVGWSTNADERQELRRAIRRVIIANLPAFADRGFTQVAITQRDEYADGMGAPMFQVMTDFSCQAPVIVAGRQAPIRDVVSTASAFTPEAMP